MRHLGDITRIDGAAALVVDCIIGGSPCQDLSVAGKRAGLAGARSGLFKEQVRITKEMREHDKQSGRADELVRPRYLVWENVPGAFSSNGGRDFAAVLEEIIRIAEPEAPVVEVPEKGWPTWGGYHDEVGGRWSVAWRVHDAQYWGVPQRRRRISLVADFGGDTAGEILFEREGLCGDIGQSEPTREGIAGETARVPDCASGDIVCAAFKAGAGAKAGSIGYASELAPMLGSVSSGLNQVPAVLLDMTHACDVIRECGAVSPSLQARIGTGGNQVPLTYQTQGFGDYREGDIASTCKRRDCKDSTDLVISATVRTGVKIRRLTPLECERLQGFPDGWTDIGEWRDSKGKLHKPSDAPRYRALGNSIALPFWRWMLRRMAVYLPPRATLGSLFDGIGGFPLLWEEIHGHGSAVWASEIEEFAIAVTRRRFPDGNHYENPAADNTAAG